MIATALVNNKKTNHFISDDEVRLLIEYSKRWGLKWQVMLGFALFRGLRIGEICAINLYDFSNSKLSKLNVVLEKSYILDEFPLMHEFQNLLRQYIRMNRHTFLNGYLFPYRNKPSNRHMDVKTACAHFSKIRKIIGKDNPGFLECKKHYSVKYRLVRLLDQGHNDIHLMKHVVSRKPSEVMIVLDKAIRLGLIDEQYSLLHKGKLYLQRKDDYHLRYRVSFHSCRRWFETRIWKHTKDKMLLRDMMRYRSVQSVEPYINSYDVWEREHEIMKDCFSDMAGLFDRVVPGQKTINDY